MAITLPTPTGNTGTNDWSDVYNNDAQLVTEIDDRDGNYQTIHFAQSFITGGAIAGTYLLGSGLAGAGLVYGAIASGNALKGTTGVPPSVFYFDDGDYTTASKTQKLRVRAQVVTNLTAPALTFTVGLYPLSSVGGGSESVSYTVGTVVSGSTVAFVTPAAGGVAQSNSGDLTIPSDGAYLLGVVTSGSIAVNSAVSVHAQLQTRWV